MCNTGDIPTKVVIIKAGAALSFCEDDAEGPFAFSGYSFDLSPKEEVKVEVGLQHIDCIGSYVEKYLIGSCGNEVNVSVMNFLTCNFSEL